MMATATRPSGQEPATRRKRRRNVSKPLGVALRVITLGLILGFLYIPIANLAQAAFNASPIGGFPIQWSDRWLRSMVANDTLIESVVVSLVLAAVSSVSATLVGGAAALAAWKRRSVWTRGFQPMLMVTLVVPWLILAVGMLLASAFVGLGRGWLSVYLGHVAVSLPYTTLIIGARLVLLDPRLEEAALVLGASPAAAFRRVILPLLGPGVVGALLVGFAMSFDNFPISYFLVPPGTPTLPVYIYTQVKQGFAPDVNVVSIIVFTVSLIAFLVAGRLVLLRPAGARSVEDATDAETALPAERVM